MGRKLEKVSSAPDFFSTGLTCAGLYSSGKQPVCRDKFIILVRIGKRTSKHSTTRGVGLVSSKRVPWLTRELMNNKRQKEYLKKKATLSKS